MLLAMPELLWMDRGPYMTKIMNDLSLLRFELDRIDDQIAELLTARARRLELIAKIKARDELPGHDPEREFAIILRVERNLIVRGIPAEHRLDVLEVFRAMLDRGRAHVKRRIGQIRSGARHDGSDEGKVEMDSQARRDSSAERAR